MGVLTYGDRNHQSAQDVEVGGAVGGQVFSPPGSQSARQNTSNGSGGSYEMNNYTAAPHQPTDFTAHGRS